LPAIEKVLRRYPNVEFELFGTIPKPESLNAFGQRVRQIPPVADYARYLETLAELEWDIGICPLAPTPFNAVKANTKWVEYTEVGTAVIASKGTIYDDCCRDDCGLLAHGEEEWVQALENLIQDGARKAALVRNAQRRLQHEYSVSRLRQQVLGMFDLARDNAGRRSESLTQEQAIA
jgi:glycosyltransferase involved in cell wall biosynthesis